MISLPLRDQAGRDNTGTYAGAALSQEGFADKEKKKEKVSQTDVEVGCVLLFGSFSLPYVCKVLF